MAIPPEKLGQELPPETSTMLALVTDPYNDFNQRARGFPDGLTTTSAVKRYSSRIDIVCPFTLAPGETWSFHVFTTPVHQTFQPDGALCPRYSNTLEWAVPAASLLGPVNVWYYKYDTNGYRNDIYTRALGESAGLQKYRSQVRTVSLGFEIHNTTAEIYRSGSLTSYRVPVMQYADAEFMIKNSTETYSYHTRLLTSLPRDVTYAQQLPNSRTWEANAGAYSVALPSPDNNYSAIVPQNFLIAVPYPPVANPTYDVPDVIYCGLQTGAKNGTLAIAPLPTWSPLSCTGCISSKYSDTNQTFTLDMRQILEIAPDPYDTVALSYATTSAAADRLFLAIYREMFNMVPCAVPVGFNSAGEWTKRVFRVVREVLPFVAHLLPPKARAVALLATPAIDAVINKVVDKKVNKLSNQPTKKKMSTHPHLPLVSARANIQAQRLVSKSKKSVTQRMLPSEKQ